MIRPDGVGAIDCFPRCRRSFSEITRPLATRQDLVPGRRLKNHTPSTTRIEVRQLGSLPTRGGRE